jgi:ubiquinone/menaquinone biosynthesis C-methylase UbiE
MTESISTIFDRAALDYDGWFDRHPELFRNELKALEKVMTPGTGIEIGVGTGRFAKALRVAVGVEPSPAMAELAVTRGIVVIKSEAENLPFHDLSFDSALMITTDCFLRDINAAFAEVHRILKNNGYFIVAIIDKESALGKDYEKRKATNPWYQHAHFHSVPEVTALMQRAGFGGFEYWQTLVSMREVPEDPAVGFGQGGFVVIRSRKI